MDNSLALSMAINRFLNHISHIGMNMWGVSKLHAAAERLGVPNWIVDIRHETTHGHMPSLTILRAGYEVCWSWICTNYWQTKRKDWSEDGGRKEKNLVNLLELHLYLKVYNTWGTVHIKDIAESHDVFSHLKRLWSASVSHKHQTNLLNMTVKQAQGLVKGEISKQEMDTEVMARILVSEDLLVPEHSFLESLVAQEEEDHVEVPSDLVAVWKELIEKIDEKIGAKVLIDLLIKKICREEVDEQTKEYCAAWVVEISEGLLGHSKALNLNKKHGIKLSDVESWISEPNRLVQMMLPCFANLVGLEKDKEAMLDDLISAAVNEESLNLQPSKTYTMEDLGTGTMEVEREREEEEMGWRREDPASWGDQILKSMHGQGWESLWLDPAAEWFEPQVTDALDDEIPEFETFKVVWPGKRNVVEEEEEIPAFYKTNQTTNPSNPQNYTPRRKRPKKA